jgi:hypothetical protein
MKQDAETVLTDVGADGGAATVSDEMLSVLKEEAQRLVDSEGQRAWQTTRLLAEAARHCVWDGQSEDSRKHQEAMGLQEAPMPFEGACDQRVRLADMIVNQKVALVVLASLRAFIGVIPVEGTDAEKASNMEIVRQYLIRGMGFEWVRELIKLANYVFGDEPGVGMMEVTWRREESVRLRRLTLDDLANLYVQRAREAAGISEGSFTQSPQSGQGLETQNPEPQNPEPDLATQIEAAGAAFREALEDPAFDDVALGGMVAAFFTDLKPARVRKIVKQLRDPAGDGTAEFPEVFTVKDGPEAFACRLNTDFFVPANTTEFQRSRIWFRPMWFSRPEVIERAREENWDEGFTAKLLEHEGEGYFRAWELKRNTDNQVIQTEPEDYRGLYEVVYGFFEGVTEDGYRAKFVIPFSLAVEFAAKERELVDYPGGVWPGHVVQREVLSDRMMDSRGIPGLASTYQDMAKLYVDTAGDHAQLTIGPIITRNRRDGGILRVSPLAEIAVRRDGDVSMLQVPPAPASLPQMVQENRREAAEYFGLAHEQVPPEVKQLADEMLVAWWLTNYAEFNRRLVRLARTQMGAERLARITNARGEALVLTPADIDGEYDIDVTFEARFMDREWVAKEIEAFQRFVLAIDDERTVDRPALVAYYTRMLAPSVAGAVLKPVDRARRDELEAEFQDYMKILGGVVPKRVADGSLNYQLRLGMYEEMQAQNPMVFASLPPDRQEILREHLNYLEAQAQQHGENVRTGQTGAPAPQLEPAAGAGVGGGA